MAGADGDGQRVHAGPLGKLDRLVGICDVIEAAAARAVSIFDTTQHADLAFNRYTALVGEIDHLAGDIHVLLECGGGLAVDLE